ncbi:hypothetical protein BU15DRAFT_53379 [Melanogaster broomeanus]|nr:hypothetical protein BU15DRAFT_53379 [Melanogaster broomeanus]
MPRMVFVGFGIDVDAVVGRLGSYGGEGSPLGISRECGMYAGEARAPRLLMLFNKYGPRQPSSSLVGNCSCSLQHLTHVPCLGHSLEIFPQEMVTERVARHEI